MSAFIVSKKTIDAICAYAEKHKLLEYGVPSTTSELGQLLWSENYRSVNYRYSEADPTPLYEYTAPPKCFDMSPEHFKSLLHCLDYQSCECDDYETSKAHKVIRELSFRADNQMQGVKEGPWGLD